MTITMDTASADGKDRDPSFGKSDGKSFVAFMVSQKLSRQFFKFKNNEGDIVDGARVFIDVPWASWAASNSLVTSRSYSSEVELQIRPTEQWGSWHTEHDE